MGKLRDQTHHQQRDGRQGSSGKHAQDYLSSENANRPCPQRPARPSERLQLQQCREQLALAELAGGNATCHGHLGRSFRGQCGSLVQAHPVCLPKKNRCIRPKARTHVLAVAPRVSSGTGTI